MALTEKGVRGLLARGEVGRHFDRDGLSLVIRSKTSAHWERRYSLNGKPRHMGLGPVRAFDLQEARERNRAITQLLADKIDPLAKRHEERAAKAKAAAEKREVVTFRMAAERYVADHQATWKSAVHGKQWRRTLEKYAYPILAHMDVNAIGKRHVLDVLEQSVDGGKFWAMHPPTGDRVRNRIELVLNYAAGRGYRDEGVNPASWDQLKHSLPPKRKIAAIVHFASVPYDQVSGVMAELARRQGVAAQALRFLILTAARTNEVTGARWDEIDYIDKKLWTIPAVRMKGGKEHRVPLSDATVELLKCVYTEEDNPFVFIGLNRERLSPGAMATVMKRLNRSESVHGFRASFKTWATEQTSFPTEAIEISLAHSVGGRVEQAYRRTDLFNKRRQLMQRWAQYVTSAPKKSTAGSDNVVALRKA